MAAAVLVKTSVFDQFLTILVAVARKISISGIKMHHFFVPELMVATIFVKTIVFDKFLIDFLLFDFFCHVWDDSLG